MLNFINNHVHVAIINDTNNDRIVKTIELVTLQESFPVNSGYKKSWGSLLVVRVAVKRTSSGGLYTGINVTMVSKTIGILGESNEQTDMEHYVGRRI